MGVSAFFSYLTSSESLPVKKNNRELRRPPSFITITSTYLNLLDVKKTIDWPPVLFFLHRVDCRHIKYRNRSHVAHFSGKCLTEGYIV